MIFWDKKPKKVSYWLSFCSNVCGKTCTSKIKKMHTQPLTHSSHWSHLICTIFVFKEATVSAVVLLWFSAAKWSSYFRAVLFLDKCEANVLPIYRRTVGEANPSKCRRITQLLQTAQFNSSFHVKEGVQLSRTSDSSCSGWRHTSTVTLCQFHNTWLKHLLKFRPYSDATLIAIHFQYKQCETKVTWITKTTITLCLVFFMINI